MLSEVSKKNIMTKAEIKAETLKKQAEDQLTLLEVLKKKASADPDNKDLQKQFFEAQKKYDSVAAAAQTAAHNAKDTAGENIEVDEDGETFSHKDFPGVKMQLTHQQLEHKGTVYSKEALLATPNVLHQIVKMQSVDGAIVEGGSIRVIVGK